MIPRLIHPVPIEIQRIDHSVTILDPYAREPVRQLWKEGQGPGLGSNTLLSGQMNFNKGNIDKPVLSPGGVEEHSKGYILLRMIDLIISGIATEAADGTIEIAISRGDLIVRIGRRVTKYYVLFFRDVGGYTDQIGGTLLEVNFADRKPGT